MDSDIKFRVFDPDAKTMELVGAIDWAYDFTRIITCNTKERKHYFGYHEDLDPIIMQYTGLKDTHYTEIYLGDVVRLFGFDYEVVFECGAFMLASRETIDYDKLSSNIANYTGCDNAPYFCMNDNVISLWEVYWNFNEEEDCVKCCEVIGNIYENPELLAK